MKSFSRPLIRPPGMAVCFLLSGILVCFHSWAAIPRAAAHDPSVSGPAFETDVQPLLRAKCLRCHGEKGRKGELDLRTLASVLKGGESGVVVVPGHPEKSLLYEKVRDGIMPPGKKDRLNQAELESIRRWIEKGARARVAVPGGQPALTQHDVIPILLRRCTVCHGPRQREGGLDLRTKAAMLRGGKSGPAIVPGKPEASLLLKKIRAGEMPPLRRLVEVSIKPIEPAETELLTQWIAQGAPEAPVQPDLTSADLDPIITDKDRSFWAFQAPRPAPVPVVRHAVQVRNPIDAFILQKLEPLGLFLSAEAGRATLMRRAYLDLTGLPPEPAEVEAFLTDRDPLAYEKMIDRLLASPRYGERWGRHWLDAAGYADSEGKREQDLLRPHAYRYRDYVIRALNADKPYDRFLLEQIAGDELADYEHVPITPEIYDNLVATGFLRMAPDPTWYNLTNFVPDRLEVIGDEIEVLSSAVMGLTMKCARCHSHKFDPIPQRDYYRLADIFKGAFDEYDWMKSTWDKGLSMGPRTDRDLPYVTVAEHRQWETEGKPKKLLEPKIRALWDRGEPSPTYMYRRGDYLSPRDLVGPGVPAVLTDGKTPFEVKPPWPGAKKTGRRLAFARWLTRPENPLTARVYVNRLWKHHFGTGIVKSLANFGRAGSPPTHPELLDWLAQEFVRQRWSSKALHRLMLTSATYRQSSLVTPELARLDPHNALFSRMPLRRMDAEVLYDTLLLAAGRLDERRYGPADAVEVRKDGLVTPVGSERGWRRSVYVQQQRKQMATIFENFDLPQMNPNCIERRDSNVAPQALHLMNNAMIHKLADHFAERVQREVGNDPCKQIERVYLIALGRLPDHEERTIAAEALAALTAQWTLNQRSEVRGQKSEVRGQKSEVRGQKSEVRGQRSEVRGQRSEVRGQKSEARDSGLTSDLRPLTSEQRALATFCHTAMNSAGFLYVD